MSMKRRLQIYIALSLDGYIARPDGDLDWLSSVQIEGEDYGYADFIATIDAVIVGRKSYDKVLSMGVEFPHLDKECYVLTRSERADEGNLRFYNGDLGALVKRLKSTDGKNIFCDGGAEVIHQLLQLDVVDDFLLSIIPIFLGDGIRLFKNGRPELPLELVQTQSFASGLVQLHYRKAE